MFNIGNLITVLSPGIVIFLASRVIAGAGAGILTAVATGAAAALVGPERRGRAMSMVTFGLSTGTVAGVPVGMIVGRAVGWQATMGLVVAIGVLAFVAVAVASPELPALEIARGGCGVGRIPQVAAGVSAAFVLGVASLGLYTYLLPAADDAGLSTWGFAFVWIWGVGGVTGALLSGRLVDRIGSRRLLPTIGVLLVAAFIALAMTAVPAVWAVAVFVWGACGWGSVPALQDMLTRTRPSQTTSVVALQMAAMYLGASVGSAAGGALLTGGVEADALPAWTAGVAAVGLVLIGAVVVLRDRPAPAPQRERVPAC